MRVYVTGGSGFVGSHVVRVFEAHAAEVAAPPHAEVDVTDPEAVRRSVADLRPDAIVHCAILNDLGVMYADRAAGWDAYVGATRSLADAANEVGARMLLVSTDWVFDGTQPGATEDTPPNPINLYGFLKAASELVVTERSERGSVARIAAVQGSARGAPREQDAGFGYFVAALVRALRAGERFTVWEGRDINMVATPTLASDAADLIGRIVAGGHGGVFHCCGGEAVDRRTLAERTVAAFGLDGDLLDFGPPPEQPWPVPHDTSLDATATAAALGVELPDVDEQLRRLERSMACTT